MLNKDKRSLILCLVLGDGCLHYFKRPNKLYGGLTVGHGSEQSDYLSWKAGLVSKITGRSIKIRKTDRENVQQFAVCWTRLRAWRKFCYPSNIKSRARILRFIRHPEMAMAIWLCDDGSAHARGGLIIHSNASSIEEHAIIIAWIKSNFGVNFRMKMQTKGDKKYPFIKLNQAESLVLWGRLRQFCLQFKSMQHKFRHIEQAYQKRLSQTHLPDSSVKI